MIIWISGPYGVGKSTLAECLLNKIENAMIFDAEEVGNAVRGNYPNNPHGVIFEDYHLWSEFNYKLLKDIHNNFNHNILVPMTLIRENSYKNIIEKLIKDGIDTKFIVLDASYENIYNRILARGEDENCWCIENIKMSKDLIKITDYDYYINTDNRSVEEISNIIIEYIKSPIR